MSNFPWYEHLNLNYDSNWQVKSFTETFLNIMSNFIPNEIITVRPRDPPWITKQLKAKLRRKSRLFNNYKRHGYQAHDKHRLELFQDQCKKDIELSKETYICNLGNKHSNTLTSQKSYWNAFNRVLNKIKAPNNPPLLVENKFLIDCKKKPNCLFRFFKAM